MRRAGTTKRKPAAHLSAEQQLYDDLRGTLHLSNVGAAAFLGNLSIESSFNPNAYNPGENAHGFAQWENGRWTALQAYARRHHLAPTSTAAEIGYLNQELLGPYHYVLNEVKRSNNVTAATQIVQSQYEGSTPDSLGARQSAARGIYGRIESGRKLTGGPTGKAVDASFTSGLIPGGGGILGGGLIPNLMGGGSALGGLGGAIGSGLTSFFTPIEHWIFRGLLVIGGAFLVVMALWIIAKSSGASIERQGDDEDQGEDEKDDAEDAGKKDTAAEAGEAAAV